jgi:1D-myo-inositol-tetrakisphosphate 5-kinase/inositol-polyphosphate multikinase
LQSIKLQNLSNDFTKPNILDIKLGTQLYDEDATPEKKERMIQAAMKTTSLETGMRMTGFQVCLRIDTYPRSPSGLIVSPVLICQVFDTGTREYITTPKSYGKSITSSQLPEAFAKFLPVLSPTLNPSKSVETTQALESTPIGIPAALLTQVIDGIYADVAAIKGAMEQLYLRMVGGSSW